MKKIILVLIGVSLNILNAYTQGVKGKVINHDGDVLPSVTIKVLERDTIPIMYFITGLNGEFNERVINKTYTLQFSFVGYESQFIRVTNQNKGIVDLGEIVLNVKNNILDEVQVIGNNMVEKVDRIIVYPSEIQMKHTSSSIELLQVLNLPGLFIDNILGKISISGTSGVKYKINNVSATYNQVAALRSNEILRVEYHQTPTARELDSNSGVINFILKENRFGTFASVDIMGAVTTGVVNGRVNAKTICNESEFSVGYVLNYRDFDKRFTDEESYYEFKNGEIRENILGIKNPFGYTNQSLSIGYTCHRRKNTIDIQFTNDFNRSFDDDHLRISNSISPSGYQRSYRADKKSYTPTLSAYYIHRINKDQVLEASLLGRLAYKDLDTKLIDTRDEAISDMLSRSSSETREVFLGEMYYRDSRNKYFSIEAGVRVSTSYTSNKYNDVKTLFNKSDAFPYLGVIGQRGNFSYQLLTAMLVYHLRINKESESNNVNNVSFLQLRYSSKRWSLRNITRYNTSSPSLSQLTDNYQRQNPLLVWKGNPTLESNQTLSNQTIVNMDIAKQIRWESGFEYHKVFKPIVDQYCYDDELVSILSEPRNAKYDQKVKVSSTLYCNTLFNIVSLRLGAEYYNFVTEGMNYRHTMNSFSWFLSVNAMYKGFGCLVNYYKPKSTLSGEFVQLDENNSSVAIRYKKKQFSIDFGVAYFLQDGAIYRSRSLNTVYNYDRHTIVKDNANMFYIKLSYSIFSGKSPFKVRKAININENETSIIE